MNDINDVLNKIHHDIEYTPKYYPYVDHSNSYIKVNDVYKILNKYRVEENKDDD